MTLTAIRTASRSPAPEVLNDINAEDCSLAIWERAPIAQMAELITDVEEDVRFTASLAELRHKLPSELSAANYPKTVTRADLTADIALLAERYAAAMSLSAIEVRVEIVTTNSCRKWHADYVEARLITTYCGTGTQWLDHEDATRVRNGLGPHAINTLGVGDVGLFKGKLALGKPVIHRSPPIEGSGEKRLLLVLNPPEQS